MPDLKDERIAILSNAVRDLRSHVAAEQAARERAQQALREIKDWLDGHRHYATCDCFDCRQWGDAIAIARKGLGETP